MAIDRGNAQGLASAASSVGHSRRQYNNQGARVQRDQFLTQELTWFVLDTGEPAGTAGNGSPAHDDNADHQNANVYLTGFHANGDPRPGERILQVLSAHMNPVIVEVIDSEIVVGSRMVPDPADPTTMIQEDFNDVANSSGNSRLLYFACESDGLHWSVDGDGNANTTGAITPDSTNANASTAAKTIAAIRELNTDLASATLSRGYFRVTTDTTDDID